MWNEDQVPLDTRKAPSLSPRSKSDLPSSTIAPVLLSVWPDAILVRHLYPCPVLQTGHLLVDSPTQIETNSDGNRITFCAAVVI